MLHTTAYCDVTVLNQYIRDTKGNFKSIQQSPKKLYFPDPINRKSAILNLVSFVSSKRRYAVIKDIIQHL